MFNRLLKEIPPSATLAMLWIAGVTSGAIDNIPVTATLLPVTRDFATFSPSVAGSTWGALITGAVLGGAFTSIASVVNVMTMAVVERENRSINSGRFLRVGMIMFTLYLFVESGYPWM